MSITLELPEISTELEEQLAAALATPEGMKQALLLLEAEFGKPPIAPLDPEMIARGKRGMADIAAGRTCSPEEFHERASAALAARIREQGQSAG